MLFMSITCSAHSINTIGIYVNVAWCIGKNVDLDLNSLFAEMCMHIDKFHLPCMMTTTKTTTKSISVCVYARNDVSFWNIEVSISYIETSSQD